MSSLKYSKDPNNVDYTKIQQNITKKIKESKMKEGKTQLKKALENLKIKLYAQPITFSSLKQPSYVDSFTPISHDVNQGFTNFCVGCTISRHFVTILTEILKLAKVTLNLDIGMKLFQFYMFRCIYLRDKDNGEFLKREETDVVPYAYLSLFMNEVNLGHFELIKLNEHYSISTGHATPIVDIAMLHETLMQNNDVEHPVSDTFSIAELSPFIEGITENDIQEIFTILTTCFQILSSKKKNLVIRVVIQGTDMGGVPPEYMLDYLLQNGQNSIITLSSAELDTFTDNWDILENPPRDADVTFKKERNDINVEQSEHSVIGYDVDSDILYIKNSYKNNGPIMKSRSGANMSILKYNLNLDSVQFIKDCIKIEIVDDIAKAKGTRRKHKKIRRKQRKSRKQNKLK